MYELNACYKANKHIKETKRKPNMFFKKKSTQQHQLQITVFSLGSNGLHARCFPLGPMSISTTSAVLSSSDCLLRPVYNGKKACVHGETGLLCPRHSCASFLPLTQASPLRSVPTTLCVCIRLGQVRDSPRRCPPDLLPAASKSDARLLRMVGTSSRISYVCHAQPT